MIDNRIFSLRRKEFSWRDLRLGKSLSLKFDSLVEMLVAQGFLVYGNCVMLGQSFRDYVFIR